MRLWKEQEILKTKQIWDLLQPSQLNWPPVCSKGGPLALPCLSFPTWQMETWSCSPRTVVVTIRQYDASETPLQSLALT